MLSFLIASSGPETAMNDMQRSPVEPDSRALRRRSRRRAACTLRHAAGIEWRENLPCCKALESHEMGKSTGPRQPCVDAGRIETSRPHAATEVPCQLRRRSLAVAASSTAPVRRKHDPVVAVDRGRDQAVRALRRCQRRIAQRGDETNVRSPGVIRTYPVIASKAKQSCVREDVLSAGCESPPHGAIPCEAESNCVVNCRAGGVCAPAAGDGVGSNRRRMRSP